MDASTPGTNPKKDVLVEVLSRSWAWLHIDGRTTGVDLPDWLRNPSVTLQIGYDMPVPIPDLKVDDWGVTATLSFRRTPHTCKIPWKAVFAVADFDGQGALFAEDMPPELVAAAGAAAIEAQRSTTTTTTSTTSTTTTTTAAAAPAAEVPPRPQPAAAPALASTDDDGEPPPEPPPEPPAGRFKSGKPRPSHLKLVG